MALLALFAAFALVIVLVIALPVLNGIGSYQANPDGRKVASKQLEEQEQRRKASRGTTSSASTGRTASSMFSRRAASGSSGLDKNPYEYTPAAPYDNHNSDDDDDNDAEGQGYTPFDYDQQDGTAAADASAGSDSKTLQKLRSTVSQTLRNKHNPLKFTPTSSRASSYASHSKRLASSASLGSQTNSLDVSKPFSSNIDNDFDYDSFIDEQEKEDALAEREEAREVELSNRKHEADSETRAKLAAAHLESIA